MCSGVKRANSAASDASEDVLEAIGEELEAAVAMLQKNYRANKLPVLVSCCFLLWLFMMVFFYRYGVNLTWAQSMFFTVDTGACVRAAGHAAVPQLQPAHAHAQRAGAAWLPVFARA